LGTLGGFEYSPDFESGFFTPSTAMMYPQTISLSAEFQVLHNFPLGWNKGKFRQKNFPYGDDAGFNAPAPQPKAPPPNGEGEGGVSEKDAATVTSAGSK